MAMPILTAEVAFGDTWNAAAPTWTDITNWVRHDPPLRISRGTSRVSRPRPGSLTLTLDNNDRRFDPDYASGPYANDLVPMVPIRVRARQGQPLQWADFPGTNGHVSSDYTTAPGQELTATARIRADDWTTSGTAVVSQYGAAGNIGWSLYFASEFNFVWSHDGTNLNYFVFDAVPGLVDATTDLWVRVVVDKYVTGGTATLRGRLYYSTDDTDDETAVSWTLASTKTTTTNPTIYASIYEQKLGIWGSTELDFAGRIYSASLRSGIPGEGQYLRNSYGAAGSGAESDKASASTGEITITARVAPDDVTPTGPQMFCSDYANNWLYLSSTGALVLTVWQAAIPTDFTSTATLGSVGVVDGQKVWVRCHHDNDNGAGGRETKFYFSTDDTNVEADVSWTQLGTTVTGAALGARDPGSFYRVGIDGTGGGYLFRGRIYSVSVRAGAPAAAVIANPKFYDTGEWTVGEDSGDTADDAQGNTWTLAGDARIHGDSLLWNPKFYAEESAFPTYGWTVGDAAAATQDDEQGNTWTLNDDVTIAGSSVPLFRGFVSDWGVNTEDFKDSTVTVTAVDGLSVLELLRTKKGYEGEVAADSPVAWWKLDETSGTTADNSGSGGTDGTYQATPSLNETGPLTALTSVLFDELSSEYVSVGATTGTDTDTAWTIEAWIYPTPGDKVIVGINTGGTTEYAVVYDTGGIALAAPGTGSSAIVVRFPNAPTIPDSVWSHIAVTFTPSNTFRLYINGALSDTANPPTFDNTVYTGTMNMAIGRYSGAAAAYWDGNLAQVAVYDSALSVARIYAHASAAFGKLSSQITSARITTILDLADWPAADRDLDTGLATMTADAANGETALTLIFEAVDTEGGACWIAKDGSLWFGNRRWRDISTFSATFSNDGSDTPYQSLGWSRDDTLLRTVAQVTDVNGQTIEYTGASEATYGPRTISRTTYTTSVTEPYDYATWLYGEFGTPHTNANLAMVAGAGTADAIWAELLSRELGDLVNVEVKPVGGTTQNDWDMLVEELQLTAGVDRWHLALGLTNANGQRGFVLDDDVLGELDGVGRLGW